MGGWMPVRRYRPHGGGCAVNLLGMLLFPLFLVMFLLYALLPSGNSGGSASQYNEDKFQDYADARYAEEFGRSSAYEDNILLTVLVDDDHYSYYYIAWVGDHIASDINGMLGSDGTELGSAMSSCINQSSYKYSLDSNLAQVVSTLSEKIQALGLESSFTCTENHAQVTSHLTNRSDLEMTEETVNSALVSFTSATGIPIVIVVDDMDDVFGGTSSASSFLPVILIAAVAIIAVVWYSNTSHRRKGNSVDSEDPTSRYHDFDDQY